MREAWRPGDGWPCVAGWLADADAPTFSGNDERANNVPVVAMPVRPGPGRIVPSLGLALVEAWADA